MLTKNYPYVELTTLVLTLRFNLVTKRLTRIPGKCETFNNPWDS